MSSRFDRAVIAAREDRVPRLDPLHASRMIAVARWHAEQKAAPPKRWPLVLGLAAAAAVFAWWLSTTHRSHDGARPIVRSQPTELALPTGDRIAATAGALLEVTSAERALRSVEVTGGTVLFDVKPLGRDHQFIVRTRDSEVQVVGTVFTVEANPTATIIRVYEGTVHVRRGAMSYVLHADDQLDADSIVRPMSGDALAEQASVRARARAAPRTTVIASPTPATETSAAAPRPQQPKSSKPERPVADPPAEAKPPVAQPADAVALLAAGNFESARDLAAANGWHIIEGDAQRALHAYREAAAAYERASADACLGAQLAARVHAEQLDNPERALELLARASEPDCDTRERALALTMQIASRSQRRDLAIQAARAYLTSFPHGNRASTARALVNAD